MFSKKIQANTIVKFFIVMLTPLFSFELNIDYNNGNKKLITI